MGPRGWGMGLAALVLGLDQLFKQIALQSLEPGAPISIAPVFSLTLGFNEGVSFGMFSDWFGGRPLALAGLTMVIAALVALWLWRAGGRSQALALGAILGGALGNILDRVRLGAVVDFLDFHVGGYHWPAFNLADASIMLGLAAMILGDLIPARRREG